MSQSSGFPARLLWGRRWPRSRCRGPAAAFPAGAVATVAGFGEQTDAANASGQLESETVRIESQGTCGQPPGAALFANNAIFVCAVSPTSEICHGDSGGGLVTTGSTPVLVGVAVSTYAGCVPGKEGIFAYTGTPELLQFIQGKDTPPTAPREASSTFARLTWNPPLVVGNTLSCATKGWSGPVQISYSFVAASDGTVLQTGPDTTFVLPSAAVGAQIGCEVAVTNAGGTELMTTGPTSGAVKPAPQVRIQPPALLEAKRGQRLKLRVVLESPAGLSGKFGVCVTLPTSVGGHLCRSTREPFGVYGAFPFDLTFTIKPTAPVEMAHIAISATAGVSSANATALLRITRH